MKADNRQNPFGVEIINCFSSAMGLLSMTDNPATASAYGRLRHDDGQRHVGMLPANSLITECNLRYSIEPPQVGVLHLSQEMEDKWDAFLHDARLYLARSWTGELVFVADVRFSSTEMIVSRVYAGRAKVFGDATMAVRQLDFLIKTLMMSWRIPAPLPPGDRIEDTAYLATYLFQSYGRYAIAGSYADTTQLDSNPTFGPVER